MPRLVLAAPLLALAALAACGAPRIPGITPYKIDIQQGNYISQDMVTQLKAGMSREQVRLTLGTPLLTDAFHGDRWDYVYWRVAPNGRQESRKFALYFSDNKLVRVDGDVVPLKKEEEEPAPRPAVQTAPTSPGQSPVQPAAPGPAGSGPATGPAPQPPRIQETR